MICLHGKTVYSGNVTGSVYVFHRREFQSSESVSADISVESVRIESAVSAVREKLTECARNAETDTERDIYDIHSMMLDDEDFLDFLGNAVRTEGVTAENAVLKTEQHFSRLFRDTGDELLVSRIDDIKDVCRELMSFLLPKQSEMPHSPVILVADELLPGELMQFERKYLKGVVMGSGTVYSHTSILIREMGIPALICETVDNIKNGMTGILDADKETVCFGYDEKSMSIHISQEHTESGKQVSLFKNLPCRVCVNINNPREVSKELIARCDGIGLFRTEYMYIGRQNLPDEEAQFSVYREMLLAADGKNVTVRTFDIGSDKSVVALPLGKEENPALGFRGLRVYSLYPEAFKVQLRALLRASVFGNLRVMYPMVTSAEEITEIKKILLQTANELEIQKIPCRVPLQGAMIETPAAALLSDKIAEKTDFLSVGTNDLVQYTLALDRQNGKLDSFCDQSQKAVIALIGTAAENAHKNGIEIGICGEMASQPEFIDKWIELGIDYLSVSPSLV